MVADLTINYSGHSWFHVAEPIQWRSLFGTLNHVKTLHVHGLFTENLLRSLLSDGEPLPEVLPDLQVLKCPVGCDASDAFATFVDACKAAVHPIRLIAVDPRHVLQPTLAYDMRPGHLSLLWLRVPIR